VTSVTVVQFHLSGEIKFLKNDVKIEARVFLLQDLKNIQHNGKRIDLSVKVLEKCNGNND